MDRVRRDDSLKDFADRPIVERPVIIVEMTDDGKQQVRILIGELDQQTNDPRLFGILMSDLLDHIAAGYHHCTGRDERDVRAELVKVMRDEDRFKEKDPTRGKLTGATVMPRRN